MQTRRLVLGFGLRASAMPGQRSALAAGTTAPSLCSSLTVFFKSMYSNQIQTSLLKSATWRA